MNRENDTEWVKDAELNLSKKDLAKKLRREAYLRAKEFKKTDPRELARKALAKEQRKAAYQKAKDRDKLFKKNAKVQQNLQDKVVLAIDLPVDERPLAPVIPIDRWRKKAK